MNAMALAIWPLSVPIGCADHLHTQAQEAGAKKEEEQQRGDATETVGPVPVHHRTAVTTTATPIMIAMTAVPEITAGRTPVHPHTAAITVITLVSLTIIAAAPTQMSVTKDVPAAMTTVPTQTIELHKEMTALGGRTRKVEEKIERTTTKRQDPDPIVLARTTEARVL